MEQRKMKPGVPSDAALLEQQDWLRVTLSSIGDAVVTTDNDGHVTFLNPVAQALTGWNQTEAAGQSLDSVFRIINEETRHTVENPVVKALREGVAVGLANHTILISRDGTEWPIDDSAAPIRNATGEVAGVVLVFRDVTERKRQERMLQDALAYADNILATLREPFLVLDQDLCVVTASHSFYETFQVEEDQTQGRFIYDLGNRQWDLPELRRLLGEVLPQNHALQNFEMEHNFSFIGRKVMLLNARRIQRPGNHSELILLAMEDITERRQTQRQLEVSETRFRRLFEAAHDGILILDAHRHQITHVNPFLMTLLGYPAEHFLGKELWEIGFLSDKQASQSAMRQLGEHGSIRYENLPLEDQQGRTRPVEMVANVYVEGHHSVIQCNIRDISDRNRLENMLREQSSELSELHRRKDEFLAMLSHELRSPLAPIANAVQLLGLQRGHENRIQQQARGIIERQLRQLQHLVDDLLEVSRITTGRLQLQRKPCIVSDIVEGAVETVRPLLEQRLHELTVKLPPEPIWLHADAARLEQVLVNLLTNAAKFTDIGGHIWLVVEQVDGEAGQCIIRVRDTGVGIAPALLPRIFDLFTQSERSLDRAQGGLGIGLALVQRITELHEGTVEARSSAGEGSEFVVRLPVMSTDTPQPLFPTSEISQPGSRALRVLVVDDNVDTVLSFTMLLRASGHDVQSAHDGPSAVQAAVDYQPDIVLLDIGLPGLNGYEVAKRIRQQASLRNVVLVAVTGYGQGTDRQSSLDAGFNHHMVKPARLAQLQQILATVAVPANVRRALSGDSDGSPDARG